MTATLEEVLEATRVAHEKLLGMISQRELQNCSFPDEPARLRIRDQIRYVLESFARTDALILEYRQARADGMVIKLSRELQCFYREVVIGHRRHLMHALRSLSNDNLDDWLKAAVLGAVISRGELGQPLPNVGHTLGAALESFTHAWDPERIDELMGRSFDPLEAERLFSCEWFRPDQWLVNEAALTPLLVEEAAQATIPGDVRLRLREAFQCFIFGNHFAAVAMARSLVEALLNRFAPSFGISLEWRDENGNTREANLATLVSAFAKKMPRIRVLVEPIREAGNGVLHSRNGEKVRQSDALTPEKALALLHDAVEVAELLYARATPHD